MRDAPCPRLGVKCLSPQQAWLSRKVETQDETSNEAAMPGHSTTGTRIGIQGLDSEFRMIPAGLGGREHQLLLAFATWID
jgi:hypothetical protein